MHAGQVYSAGRAHKKYLRGEISFVSWLTGCKQSSHRSLILCTRAECGKLLYSPKKPVELLCAVFNSVPSVVKKYSPAKQHNYFVHPCYIYNALNDCCS